MFEFFVSLNLALYFGNKLHNKLEYCWLPYAISMRLTFLFWEIYACLFELIGDAA